MKITFYSSTNEVIGELGNRVKAARIAMDITQNDMAEMTGLSKRTISNLETGKDVSFSTFVDVLRALGKLQSFEAVLPEQTVSPIRIAELGKPRERSRRSAVAKPETNPGWKWGDQL